MAKITDNQKAKAGIRARQDAIQSLIHAHQEEFDRMHEENRVRLGLPRRASSDSPEQIQAKLERARKRLEQYEKQLAEFEADQRLARR